MSKTTSNVLIEAIGAFNHEDSYLSPRGTRIYWAATHLQSDASNGRYEIEQLSKTAYVVTHHQVIQGGRGKITRRVASTSVKTKGEAMQEAKDDSVRLAENVFNYLLKKRNAIITVTAVA